LISNNKKVGDLGSGLKVGTRILKLSSEPEKDIMEKYDSLNIRAEIEEHTSNKHARIKQIYAEMQNLWLKEKIKARQRSRDRDIKKGDQNVAYFHVVANQMIRKCLVHSLDRPEGLSQDNTEKMKISTDFYRNLFKKKDPSECHLANDFFFLEKKINLEHNHDLEVHFSVEEVKNLYLTPT
jgi:hypothetical protein